MNTKILIGAIILIILGAVLYKSFDSQKDAMMSQDKEMMRGDSMMNEAAEDKMMGEQTSMMNDEEKMMDDSNKIMMKSGKYETYSPENLARAQTGKTVLFFRASWCPSCKTIDADIKANLSKIPEYLTILDVNYDSNNDLRKKYGVTYQHTFVQIDKDGNMINKWSGGESHESIISKLK